MLARLFAWQSVVQLVGLIGGFALLHWLDVEAYAQYALAFAFVTTLSLLVDLGFGHSVVGLVAERADDDAVVKQYIASARGLRNRAMLVLIPVASVAFLLTTEGKEWSWGVRLGLLFSVAVTVVARSFQDFYGLRLILAQDHAAYMRPQLVAGIVRLLSLAAARAAGVLTAVLASLLSVLLAALPTIQYRRRTGRIRARGAPLHEREIVSYALPLAPMLLYTAAQSQLPIFVASWFASTRAIAEVGALSRLAQVYALVGIVNFMVIAPQAARAARPRLMLLLRLSIIGACAFVALITLSAVAAPGLFVKLLGSEYGSVESMIAPYLLGTGLLFISGVVFAINSARGFTYWWLTGLLIFGVCGAQIVGALILDLSSVLNIVLLLVISGVSQLLVSLVGLWFGLTRGPRRTNNLSEMIVNSTAES
jgi:O-antigen/teichoic acid export membrane protein